MTLRLRLVLLTAILAVFAVVSVGQLTWAFSDRPVVSAGHILERWDKAFVRHVHPVWLGENFPGASLSFVSQDNPSNYFVWDEEVSGWSGLTVDYSKAPLDGIGQIELASLDPAHRLTNHIVCQQEALRCNLHIVWSDAGRDTSNIEFVGVRVSDLDYLLVERAVLVEIAPQLAAEAGD